ncbi:glycosyltransferase [bacterium]|nr:glycosyltransferase [bacterium]
MKLNITLPCYNEDKILNNNIIELFDFLSENIAEDDWQIIIADNNSTDNTAKIAQELTKKFEQVKYLFIAKKGKGIAIKSGWQKFEADIYIFMDADLSTNLNALPELINSIKKENYDIAVGSRFHKKSKVNRTIIRKFISNGYRFIKKIILNSNVADMPCGFKAVNKKTIEQILPKVRNNEWFFDSELLILAEHFKYKIKEIPVKWEDIREGEDKSKVKIISLGIKYFKNLLELKKRI